MSRSRTTGSRRRLTSARLPGSGVNLDERILSCVVYLNENWRREDGGELRLHVPDENGNEQSVDVLPEPGLLVSFLSDRIPHEVLPTRRERLSIASWFRGRPRQP